MTPASLARAAVGLAAFVIAATAAAHGTEWAPALRLSPPGVQSWFPDVATDIAGGVHVFWSHGDATARYDAVIYCALSSQGCSTITDAQRRYGHDGNYIARPTAAVDRHGTMHLIWRRKYDICHTTAALPGSLSESSWARLHKLGSGTLSTIAIDAQGTLHAAWSEGIYGLRTDPCFGCADIFYSRSDDGGERWSQSVNVSKTVSGSEKPHLAFGKGGLIYVAWEEGRDHYVGKGDPQFSMLKASTDGGRTWGPAATFSLPDDAPQSIALGVDHTERVVVAWQGVTREEVYFQTSDDRGRTWTSPAPIAGVRNRTLRNKLDDYDMAADAAGHLHLVLSGRRDGYEQNSVLHLEWDGLHWSAPTALHETDGAPEWPRIAVGNGNQIHAVWFERPGGSEWDSEHGEYAVWYARGQSAASAIAPLTWSPRTPAWLTLSPWLRVAQAVAAIATLTIVISRARKRGW